MQQDAIIARKRLTASMAALALAVPFAGVALAGEPGKGGERPQEAPGQEKKAENAAAQSDRSTSGRGYGAGKSTKPARPAKAARPAKPDRPAKARKPAKAGKPAKPSRPVKPRNPHAAAGKTTICHATGSKTNPYVKITVSDNALRAHTRHQGGRDIVPAPEAGCPAGESKDAARETAATAARHDRAKVTICHATGSETNPYVKITVAEPALAAHRRHQHGEDIVPAPEGDCPAPATAALGTANSAPRRALGLLLPAPAAALVAPASRSGVLGSVASGTAAPQAGVLGVTASGGGVSPSAAAAPATVTRETGADARSGSGSLGSLPFTGIDLWVLLAAGLGAILAGVTARRAATHRPTA